MSQTRLGPVDTYVASFPRHTQVVLKKLRQVIRTSAPGAEETISWGMPAYRLNGYLVFFAAHTHHIGLYPMPSAIAAFKEELSRYKHAKGSIQFPLDKPIPYGLVKRIVRFRVKEARARK